MRLLQFQLTGKIMIQNVSKQFSVSYNSNYDKRPIKTTERHIKTTDMSPPKTTVRSLLKTTDHYLSRSRWALSGDIQNQILPKEQGYQIT